LRHGTSRHRPRQRPDTADHGEVRPCDGRPCRRTAVGLPDVVGLLFAGILFGPHGLDAFGERPIVADFFSDLGKLLLMFFAGLEVDLGVLRRARTRSVVFGLATTLLPLLAGTLVGLAFGFGAVTAVVIGSLLASHTLLGLPVVKDAGAARREAITVTVGATVISDTLSLIVFSVCLTVFLTGFSAKVLTLQLIEIAGFCACILWGLGTVGAILLRRMETEEAYFVLLLLLLAISSVLAEIIGLPGIVGAFLAGLAVDSVVQEKPAASKLNFIGKTLFIPAFFIVTGFLIDPVAFVQGTLEQFPLIAGMFVALLAGKWAAVVLVGQAYRYSAAERLVMVSLTLPQVAATLAATLVAHGTVNTAGQALLDDRVLNAVLALVLITSILGPLLTARFVSLLVSNVVQSAEPAELN
jgi:Kef-type K+ transport system membrane component KefB